MSAGESPAQAEAHELGRQFGLTHECGGMMWLSPGPPPPVCPSEQEETMRSCGAAAVLVGLATSTYAQSPTIDLTLSSDRTEYYVGQAVRLDLVVSNQGQSPIHGFLLLAPWLPAGWKTSSLSYCRGAACHEFLLSIPYEAFLELHVATTELEPGRQQKSRITVAWDERRSQFVLDAPGEYEFRWVTTGIFMGPNRPWDHVSKGPELSAAVRIRVHPMPPSEGPAFELYRELNLGTVAQHSSQYSLTSAEIVQSLLRFLKEFPTSVYAETLRGGAAGLLEGELRGGRLQAKDKAFVEQYLASARSAAQ